MENRFLSPIQQRRLERNKQIVKEYKKLKKAMPNAGIYAIANKIVSAVDGTNVAIVRNVLIQAGEHTPRKYTTV